MDFVRFSDHTGLSQDLASYGLAASISESALLALDDDNQLQPLNPFETPDTSLKRDSALGGTKKAKRGRRCFDILSGEYLDKDDLHVFPFIVFAREVILGDEERGSPVKKASDHQSPLLTELSSSAMSGFKMGSCLKTSLPTSLGRVLIFGKLLETCVRHLAKPLY